jgi:RNA-binding protein YlmH
MNKEEFLKILVDIDKATASKIYDKMILAQKTGKVMYTTEFYPPNIWGKLSKASASMETKFFTYGVFEDAERRILVFSQEEPVYYPVKLIEIKNKSKFSALEHKDYLGALMSLGVKREKMGDLLIDGDRCYGAVYEEVYEYIKDNLDLIGKSPCVIREIIDEVEIPKVKFEDKVVISTSYRLDSIVGSLCGLSRSKAVEIIGSGKVLVNYTPSLEKDFAVHVDDVLTIRGFGKYRIRETIGNSGSGRLKIIVKKYI